METRWRSLVKTISWRIMASAITTLLVFAFTGNLTISLGVGLLEIFVKIAAYNAHERLWNLVDFGRASPPKDA